MRPKKPKQSLIELMMDLSEDYWCAGWMNNMEYVLWVCVVDPANCNFSPCGSLASEEIRQLKELSEEAGGWAWWHPEQGATFVELDAWQAEFARFREDPASWPTWPGCLVGEEECEDLPNE